MPTLEQEVATEIKTLCQLYGVTALSPKAAAHVRAVVARRRTRDDRHTNAVAELDRAQSDEEDPDFLPRNTPGGDQAPVFRADADEEERLPPVVSVREQRQRYSALGFDQPNTPFAPQGQSEGATQSLARLNAAQRRYYSENGAGHAPGQVSRFGPTYGATGETDRDYGRYAVSNEGRDPTPRRRSPTPTDPNWVAEENMGGFDADEPQAMRSGPVERTDAERDFKSQRVNRQPYVGSDYPSGPSPIPTATGEQGEKNYGIATSGYPRSSDPVRVRPDDFDPHHVEAGFGDAAQLRSWNNANRQSHGDAPIRTALPRQQMPEGTSEAVDWRGHRTYNGAVL